MFPLTPLVRSLLILNVVMFVLPEIVFPVMGLGNREIFVDFFGLRYILSPLFQPTQLISYSLIHASWGHLFSNMLGLLVFGPLLEQVLGPRKFLLYYFGTAIGAGLIYSGIHFAEVYPFVERVREFQLNPDPDLLPGLLDSFDPRLVEQYLTEINHYAENPGDERIRRSAVSLAEALADKRMSVPMVGASGAIFGVMLGFGYLFPNQEMMLLFPPIPVKAKYLVGFYGIYALYSAVERVPGDNVAHFAHLGGMLVGYLFFKAWRIRPLY